MKTLITNLLFIMSACLCFGQTPNYYLDSNSIYLNSKDGHNGQFEWKMCKAGDVSARSEDISQPGFSTAKWMSAIVPGTVLNSLVYNKVYPEPNYGINNKLGKTVIPDLSKAGRDFYTYWFRTEFNIPENYKNKLVWLQLNGINYRAEIWVNGHLLSFMSGMFRPDRINITEFANIGGANALAVKVYPVDIPGTTMHKKKWGHSNEFQNAGDGNIGQNITMLMSVGWDFTYMDGVRDRNTGIWKDIQLYATDKAVLSDPFVKSKLNHPDYNVADETVSVEVYNPMEDTVKCTVKGEITGENIAFSKDVVLYGGEKKVVTFTPDEFSQLTIKNPRLWWPRFKGKPELYELKMTAMVNGAVSSEVKSKFGIREIKADTESPDESREFLVNGKKIFIRGTNWIPDAMLRTTDSMTYAELRYTYQSGVNMVRIWGGGIPMSDYFYQLCDEMGLLVWQEFWITGDSKHPHDYDLYLSNVQSTVKRLRNHASLAYYVCSNESSEVPGVEDLIMKLDGTRCFQMESECCGVHDGSPYIQVNPMQYYEDTASPRGSRVNGFNPEYGFAVMPTIECLREMMDAKDLWPINQEVWDYLEGEGFYGISKYYKDMAEQYGKINNIEDFARQGQVVNGMDGSTLWEAWNYNKFSYGDRYTSGMLFWYFNSPVRQLSSHLWDYSLEPNASLYYTAHALEPLHPQFDFLKNTVSVYNDYFKAFKGYKVTADVYDLNSQKIWSKSASVDVPEDGVANDVFKIDFSKNATTVSFIKLRLYDAGGKEVASQFYWRSNNKYTGPRTISGPTTAGFQDMAKMKQVDVKASIKSYISNGRHFVEVTVTNPSSIIAFYTQLQLLDANAKPVRPSFYTDNFFSLLPGESRHIVIETAMNDMPSASTFVVKGWNIKAQKFAVKDKAKK
jgi:mannosylglycoprotein endo-beta-mannosidase